MLAGAVLLKEAFGRRDAVMALNAETIRREIMEAWRMVRQPKHGEDWVKQLADLDAKGLVEVMMAADSECRRLADVVDRTTERLKNRGAP